MHRVLPDTHAEKNSRTASERTLSTNPMPSIWSYAASKTQFDFKFVFGSSSSGQATVQMLRLRLWVYGSWTNERCKPSTWYLNNKTMQSWRLLKEHEISKAWRISNTAKTRMRQGCVQMKPSSMLGPLRLFRSKECRHTMRSFKMFPYHIG